MRGSDLSALADSLRDKEEIRLRTRNQESIGAVRLNSNTLDHDYRQREWREWEPDWMAQGACGGENAVLMERALQSRTSKVMRDAKRVCQSCPVREECLEFELAMETNPNGTPSNVQLRFGVFGGLSPAERYTLAMERAS